MLLTLLASLLPAAATLPLAIPPTWLPQGGSEPAAQAPAAGAQTPPAPKVLAPTEATPVQHQDELRPDLVFSVGEDLSMDNAAFADWMLRIRGPIRAEEFAVSERVRQRALEAGLSVSPEQVEAEMEAAFEERIAKAFNGDRQAWLEEVSMAGMTLEGLKHQRRLAIGQSQLAKQLARIDWTPKEERLVALWERRYGPGGNGLVLRAIQRQIVNEYDPSTMDREQYHRRGEELAAEAVVELNEIRARALAGESFAGLAARLSDDAESKARGGLLEGEVWNPEGWPKAFVESLTSLKPGEISAPLEARGGLWLFQLESRRLTPLEDVRAELLAEMLANGPEQDEVDAFVTSLAPALPMEVLPAMQSPDLTSPEGWQAPVLKVGEQTVSAAQYEAWLRNSEGEQMAQRLALLELVNQQGKELGFKFTPEQIEARIDSDLELIIESGFKGRRAAWEADLAKRQRTVESWRREARDRAKMDLVLEAMLFADPDWLEQHLRMKWAERFGAEGVWVNARLIAKQIVVEPRGDNELERIYKARVSTAGAPLAEELERIAERVRDGEDFGAIARRESTDTESARLGGVPPGGFQFVAYDEMIRSALINAKVGEVVGPYQSGEQILLFEVLERRAVPFEQEREKLLVEARQERLPQVETFIVKNRLFKPDMVRYQAGLYR